jgi:hypothetical protein
MEARKSNSDVASHLYQASTRPLFYGAFRLPVPCSRQTIKKYIQANNKTGGASQAVFDSQFNKAIRTGVEKGDFNQPKGTFRYYYAFSPQ